MTKWANITLNEKAVAHTHFNELCALLGVDAPLDADPSGTFYRFEKPLTKAGGGAGFADVWRKDCFAWEYKSVGKYPNLKAAHDQLLIYKGDLENPPVLGACDVANFDIHVDFTGYKTVTRQFHNTDLVNADTRDFLRFALTEPEQLRPIEKASTITEKAAARFADVAQLLEKRGFATARIASFFTKLVFALFVEDIHLLPNSLMTHTLRKAIFLPSEFPAMVGGLFQAMRSGCYFGPGVRVPRFNGGLFDDDDVLPLNADEIQFLADAALLDWSQVEPAIFGTLFERSLNKQKRAQLGAHYTSKDDILLIVEPVLMAPLRREWEQVKQEIEPLRLTWETATGAVKQQQQNKMEGGILDFMVRLAKVRVLDPAAGSGNFLYVSLSCLKDLEKEVLIYATGIGLTAPELSVSPTQLYGIEKNDFAAALAQIVVWIGYLQWNRNNGFDALNKHEPILKTLSTIECRDAILTLDANNQPVEPAWPEADVIVGNPPFLGNSKLRSELGEEYVAALRTLYAGRVPSGADLVCYWFERSRSLIECKQLKRAGLLATQAIRSGYSRTVLDRVKETGNIFLAWSDRPWMLEGAAVRVSMVGFDDGTESLHVLNGCSVASIHANLTGQSNLTMAQRLSENTNIAFEGDKKYGAFDITTDVANAMLAAPVNAHGQCNRDVVRPWVNGLDVTKRPRGMWIIDFGVSLSEEDAALYEVPFNYLKTHVKPEREKLHEPHLNWWIHQRTRPAMRKAIALLDRYIVTPRVAKHRIFAWQNADVLPDTRLSVIAHDDDYFFGVLHSRIHEVWSLATSSRHGDGDDGGRPTYNNTTCFETFPFPWSPNTEVQNDPHVAAIAEAARVLVQLRDAWLHELGLCDAERNKRTLTNLYNKRPDWLDSVHQHLDAAVFDAYGWPHDLSDEQMLERLLALNLDRAAQQGYAVASPHIDAEEADE